MKSGLRIPGLVATFALLLLSAWAYAAVAQPSLGLYYKFLDGQGTGMTLQHTTSTANTKILELLDDSGASVFSADREGDVSAGSVSAQHVLPAGSTQTVATSGTIAITAGKSLLPVAGSGGAVTTVAVADGTVTGQLVVLKGTNDTNTVSVAVNGATKIKAANGQTARVLGAFDQLTLLWDGAAWVELSFSNNT